MKSPDNFLADTDFQKLIANKSVIFVGPAPYLIGKGQGDWIDHHDVVVRSNGSIFMTDEELIKDYGRRCDVLYVNVQFIRETFPIRREFISNDKCLRFMCFKAENPKVREEYGNWVETRCFERLVKTMSKQVQGLLTGTAILQDITLLNPRSFDIVGMDFYKNKPNTFIPNDWREYYPGYLPEVIETRANTANVGRTDPHNYRSNADFIYKFLVKPGRVKVDYFIKDRIEDLLGVKVP